ncbi:MAG: adenylosuccinate lyase [Clostridiales bacterium]|nr:adenylosuccinate lyase [Clostridiales bacterium]
MKGIYVSPLAVRYADADMQYLFSEAFKFKTWRALWIALAESQQALGLDITNEQINELKAHKDDINYADAQAREKITRHDVMAHIYAYGLQCPKAKPIIHLGATSCYVGDNTDIIIMKNAMALIKSQLVTVVRALVEFAKNYESLPTLGFTHLQPAQLTTVGKRACLWIQDLMIDLDDICALNLPMLGSKGTTGTQASFKELFGGDLDKAMRLDFMIAAKMGFDTIVPVSGQTYSRKWDAKVVNILSGIAQSAAKFSNDIRLLQHMKEVEEPFEATQVGSSAMAYKRNPMRCERIAALCRYVIANSENAALTAQSQWFERTLDDSANKRIAVAESFLAVNAVLNIYANVAGGLIVYPKMIHRHIMEELPFMATENIMMNAVKNGGDRQVLHERIRELSIQSARRVKEEGLSNDLLERIANDPAFNLNERELGGILDPSDYTGFAERQTVMYLDAVDERLRDYTTDKHMANVTV